MQTVSGVDSHLFIIKKGHEFSAGGKLTKNTKITRSTVFLMWKNQRVYSDLLESI